MEKSSTEVSHIEAEQQHQAAKGEDDAAQEATQFELSLTLRQAIKYYPWAIFWSVVLSCSIIMEGYDIVLIGNLMAQPAFQRAYGGYYGEELGYQISGAWQLGIGCATAIGTIVGAFANGW